jgi:hypothetical protein
MWEGCDLWAWIRLLGRNRVAISPRYWYVAATVTYVGAWHWALRQFQDAWLGERPERTPLVHEPLFIVGHWRTGTTLLHELLILDERHTCPNTYQCLCPSHFLISERLFTRLFRWILPSRRPMDNMPFGWDRPQEDEFAMCLLGQPSPYESIAFPNRQWLDEAALRVDGLPPGPRRAWKRALVRFLRQVSFKDPRRLVLKSPTHSFRIPTLLELFPDARFVHIVRDPHVVFPSTINLWTSLYRTHGLQTPTFAGLEEHVLETFVQLYERLEEGRRHVAAGRWHELRYEDLVADPVGQVRRLYDALVLGGFERVRSRVEQFQASRAGYTTNRYPILSPRQRAAIADRWGAIIRRYGYDRPQQTPVPPTPARATG